MTLKISPTSSFIRQAKRLTKKYRQLPADLKMLDATLRDNPCAGVELTPRCFKIRLANSTTQSGKNGGFRIIYYYLDEDNQIYLLSIYSKTEQGAIDDAVVLELIKEVLNER